MYRCITCDLVVCHTCKEKHANYCNIIQLLENYRNDKQNIVDAVEELRKIYDPTGVPIAVYFNKCDNDGDGYEDGDVAKANKLRIVLCEKSMLESFQSEESKGVINFDKRFGVTHLTIVVIHEVGHVLDRRDKLPTNVMTQGKYRSEERANAFVTYFLNKVKKL